MACNDAQRAVLLVTGADKGTNVHKVFISYYHRNDQIYKEGLVTFGKENKIFIDRSVDTGDISDALSDEAIREKIRDEYLRDSTVTIVLVGTETKARKHVDWEIHSSMFDGRVNKKSGILVVNLPSIDNGNVWSAHGAEEKSVIFPDFESWECWSTTAQFEEKFPYMPSRIVENLVSGAKISVVGWDRLTVRGLTYLLDATFSQRSTCRYYLGTPLRRRNS